jgi:transcriptional regulator with XRE-family HTH domain
VLAEADIAKLRRTFTQIENRHKGKAATKASHQAYQGPGQTPRRGAPPCREAAAVRSRGCRHRARPHEGRINQEELAQRLSTNQGNIARLERSHTQATVRTLKRIAAATGHPLVIDFQKSACTIAAAWKVSELRLERGLRNGSGTEQVINNAPLATLIIGVALILVSATGAVRYSGETFLIDTAWRYILAALEVVLTGVGIYKETSPGGGKLTIDLTRIRGQGEPSLEYSYNKLSTVDGLLDLIYAAILPDMPRCTYGTRWVLSNKQNGVKFRDIGLQWAAKHGLPKDTRVLKDAGIKPGMTLVVEPLIPPEKA